MPSFSRTDVVLLRYDFSDLTAAKVRPAVIVGAPHPSRDLMVVPLTSRAGDLLPGEFALADWRAAGLHVPTAVKRGVSTLDRRLVVHTVGSLSAADAQQLDDSLHAWLGL